MQEILTSTSKSRLKSLIKFTISLRYFTESVLFVLTMSAMSISDSLSKSPRAYEPYKMISSRSEPTIVVASVHIMFSYFLKFSADIIFFSSVFLYFTLSKGIMQYMRLNIWTMSNTLHLFLDLAATSN